VRYPWARVIDLGVLQVPVDAETRLEPKTTLQDMEVHSIWVRQFRSGENAPFYKLAFDHIASVFGTRNDETVFDAGCGSGTKSFELARRGYRVRAMDFSATILEQARAAAAEQGYSDRISFCQGDLTALSLPSCSVHRAVCWGVLMHVPDIGAAVAELARITAPGGRLVVSEGNARSLQAFTLRWIEKLLGRERAEIMRTPAGIEFWEETSTARLMTRQADIRWLIAEFRKHGLHLVERRAGQFTEIYVLLPWKPLRMLVHAMNNFWFRWIRLAGPAYGNLLVLQRLPQVA
jgi:ubiquinone/menaquinone biosynthesis C-methylase UbiE